MSCGSWLDQGRESALFPLPFKTRLEAACDEDGIGMANGDCVGLIVYAMMDVKCFEESLNKQIVA